KNCVIESVTFYRKAMRNEKWGDSKVKTKNWVWFGMVAILLFIVTACTDNNSNNKDASTPPASSNQQNQTEGPTTPPPAEPVKQPDPVELVFYSQVPDYDET